MRISPTHRPRGFTLLELLIALAIFSLIAVMAYGGLATVLEQNLVSEESAVRLAALQKTYLVLQRDIEQVVPRPIRNEFGDRDAALVEAPLRSRNGQARRFEARRGKLARRTSACGTR